LAGQVESDPRRFLVKNTQSHGMNAPPVGLLANQLAVFLHARANYTQAESLCRRALAIDEASFEKPDRTYGRKVLLKERYDSIFHVSLQRMILQNSPNCLTRVALDRPGSSDKNFVNLKLFTSGFFMS
jgi:hypothetical protein